MKSKRRESRGAPTEGNNLRTPSCRLRTQLSLPTAPLLPMHTHMAIATAELNFHAQAFRRASASVSRPSDSSTRQALACETSWDQQTTARHTTTNAANNSKDAAERELVTTTQATPPALSLATTAAKYTSNGAQWRHQHAATYDFARSHPARPRSHRRSNPSPQRGPLHAAHLHAHQHLEVWSTYLSGQHLKRQSMRTHGGCTCARKCSYTTSPRQHS